MVWGKGKFASESIYATMPGKDASFVFFARKPSQINDERRRFQLSQDDFLRLNPNTLTCPIFRSRMDAELARKIYRRVPVLVYEARGNEDEKNSWGISIRQGLFHLTNDIRDGVVIDSSSKAITNANAIPVWEGKQIHQFDHRWAGYEAPVEKGLSLEIDVSDKKNPNFSPLPRYWVDKDEVEQRLKDKGWDHEWLLGWRDVTSAHVLRTVIACILPRVGIAYTIRVIVKLKHSGKVTTALLGNFNSLVCDYVARQALGGNHLSDYIVKQLPILPPSFYSEIDLNFIVPRILELTYTTSDLQPWAQDLGYDGPPFTFDLDRRAQLRAELDAWYAKAYGLSRDELRYILDPADVMGDDYPSETFRVLKNNELKEFGEYRTRRLVLEAWDKLASGTLS